MFNNGYNSFYPYQGLRYNKGLFSSLKGKFNWSSILNNTQKTLNIINQAIPVIYQIKPIWNNTKTIFKIMGAIKEDDNGNRSNSRTGENTVKKQSNNSTSTVSSSNTNQSYDNMNAPHFFL